MRRAGKGFPLPVAGSLTPAAQSACFAITSGAVRHMAFSNDGKSLYFPSGGKLNLFARDTETGKLTSSAEYAAYTAILAVCVSPDDKHVYSLSNGYEYVVCWSRNLTDGTLTALSTFTQPTGTDPRHITISQDGKTVYVANYGSGTLTYYARTAANGILGAPTTVTGLSLASGVIVSPDNAYVYVSSQTRFIFQFSRNTTSGAPTALSPASVATPASPGWPTIMAIDSLSKNLYCADDGNAITLQFGIGSGTGLLSALSPAYVSAGNGPWAITITPNDKYVYVADSDGQTISQYVRDLTGTGGLTAQSIPRVRVFNTQTTAAAASGGPQSVIASPDSKHVYASGSELNASGLAIAIQFNVQ